MCQQPEGISRRLARRRKREREGSLNVATCRTDQRSLRYFEVGELWWVEPHGWERLRSWSENPDPHPGMVLLNKTAGPNTSVPLAPGTSQPARERPGIFSPQLAYEIPVGLWEQCSFFLCMHRDVRARYIMERKARLSGADRELLRAQLAELQAK